MYCDSQGFFGIVLRESGRVKKNKIKPNKLELHSRGFWSGHSSKVVKGINISRALCFPPGQSLPAAN